MNIFYPKCYLQSVLDITPDFLKSKEIQGLILDIDNTIMDIDKKFIDGLKDWNKSLNDNGIKTIIVSNTSKKYKAENASKILGVEYIMFAKKPAKSGFLKGAKMMGLEPKNVASVGDQIFTDVIGANMCGMYSILVKLVDPRDLWYTGRYRRRVEESPRALPHRV